MVIDFTAKVENEKKEKRKTYSTIKTVKSATNKDYLEKRSVSRHRQV